MDKQTDQSFYEFMKPFRRSYVRANLLIKQKKPLTRIDFNAPVEWEEVERTVEGIVGYTKRGEATIGGQRFGKNVMEWGVELLFTPSADAIKLVCHRCKKLHPLPLALDEARVWTNHSMTTQGECSLCGNPGRFHGLHRIPEKYWRFQASTPHEVIENGLIDIVFRRKLVDNNVDLCLLDCGRIHKPGSGYRLLWKCGPDYYLSEQKQPPPAGWWERLVPISEIKEHSDNITADGNKIYGT